MRESKERASTILEHEALAAPTSAWKGDDYGTHDHSGHQRSPHYRPQIGILAYEIGYRRAGSVVEAYEGLSQPTCKQVSVPEVAQNLYLPGHRGAVNCGGDESAWQRYLLWNLRLLRIFRLFWEVLRNKILQIVYRLFDLNHFVIGFQEPQFLMQLIHLIDLQRH